MCSTRASLLFALTALLFGRCWVHFKVWQVHRRMPLLVGFALVALFIWFAENIGTFTAAWMYPNQRHGWTLVSFGKLGAWFLLMIISYVLVALVNRPQAMPATEKTRSSGEVPACDHPQFLPSGYATSVRTRHWPAADDIDAERDRPGWLPSRWPWAIRRGLEWP